MRLLALALLVAVAAVLTTTAFAQNGVIQACVKPNGNLRIVASPADCNANETPLAWNQQGPPGQDGAPGEPGEQGEPGPPGTSGAQLSVFDATGAEIGLLVDSSLGEQFIVYLESVDATILLAVDGTWLVESPGGQIIFEDFDCQGQGFVPLEFVARVTGESGRFFIGRRGAPPVDLGTGYESRWLGACANDQNSGPINDVIPADEILFEDLGLTFPLPGPIYVAPTP